MRGAAPVAPTQPPPPSDPPAALDTEWGTTRPGVVCGGPGLYSVRTVGKGGEDEASRPSVLCSGGVR